MILDIQNLQLERGTQRVLNKLNLHLVAGEFVGLIGPNGSGKTSLLHAMVGRLPYLGSIRINQLDLATSSLQAKHQFGFAPDPNSLPLSLYGRQTLLLMAQARGLTCVPDSTLEAAEALQFSPWMDRLIEEYSLGTRQKLALLLGLIGDAPLLIFDEPLNGLDPISALRFKQILQARVAQQNCTVLLATHALDVAERFLSRAILLLDGKIAAQWTTAQLQTLRESPEQSLEQAVVAHLLQSSN